MRHCGAFEALEQQLMAIGGAEGEDGLDAADALVWTLLKLLPAPKLGRPHVWRA